MKIQDIQPFVRQGLFSQMLLGKYLFTRLKTRDCRLFYILEGTGTMCIEETPYAVEPGSVILFQTDTEYIWQIENVRYVAINFDYTQENSHIRRTFSPVRAEIFPADNFSRKIVFDDAPELNRPIVLAKAAALGEQIRSLALEYHMREDFSDELMSAQLKSILIRLLRLHRGTHCTSERKSAQIVRESMEYIQNHFQQSINNQDIAAQLHFHPSYINRVFRAHTGMSLHAFLNDYRLNYAMEMLRSQDMSVGQVAAACGFRDTAHFTKAFKEHTGQTPSEYRLSD